MGTHSEHTTRRSESTTSIGAFPEPILQVPQGW